MNLKTNYVGIDTSLSSTGMYIITKEGKEYYFNYKNTKKLSKWHKVLSYTKYSSYDNIKTDEYGTTEIAKLLQYDNITEKMVSDITSVCDLEETIVVTEGYSYSSSNTSSLIDLIGYATLLRIKILKHNVYDFIIKPPSSLKMETGACTYEPNIKEIGGKNPRTEYSFKNPLGLSAGSFQKHDMLEAMFDNTDININIKKSLLEHKTDLLKMKSIPTPISDLVDAVWLVYTEILKTDEVKFMLENTTSAHNKKKKKKKKKS